MHRDGEDVHLGPQGFDLGNHQIAVERLLDPVVGEKAELQPAHLHNGRSVPVGPVEAACFEMLDRLVDSLLAVIGDVVVLQRNDIDAGRL